MSRVHPAGGPVVATRSVPEKVQAVLAGVLGVTADDAVRLTKGLFNECWKVSVDGRPLLVKFRAGADAEERFRRVERVVTDVLRGGLMTPAVLAVGRCGHGEAFAVQEWVDGLDGEDHVARFLSRLGAVVAALHRIASSHLPTVTPPLPKAEANLAEARARGLIRAPDARAGTRLLWAHHPAGPVPRGLVHRDLHPPNVLVAPDGTVGLLDFDHAAVGDPIEDFVKLRWWVFDESRVREEAFVAGYTSAGGRLAGDAEDRLAFHEMATCASYLVYASEQEPHHLPEWQARFAALLSASGA
jgi:aminoglycoside phosphotransferase (APT) family kinase protein